MEITPLSPTKNFRQIKELSDLVFPIKYPDSWLEDVLSPRLQKTVCFGVFDQDVLVSMLVARIMSPPNTDLTIPDIAKLCLKHKICYVVMLGTRRNYRRQKLATKLMDKLVEETSSSSFAGVQLEFIMLHSIAYQNYKFYENYGFEAKHFLQNYSAFENLCPALKLEQGMSHTV